MANIKFYRGSKALGKPNNDTLVASSSTNANSILFIKGETKAGVNNNTSVGRIYLDSYAFGSSIYDVAVTESANLGKISLYGIDGNSKEYHVVNTVTVTDNSNYVNLTTSSSSGNVTLTLSDSIGTALNGKIGTGQVGKELVFANSSIGHKMIENTDANYVLNSTSKFNTAPSVSGSGTTRTISIPYIKVNPYGHVIAESTTTLNIPDNNTTYSVDTEKELTTSSTNIFAHEVIADLSTGAGSLNSSDGNKVLMPTISVGSIATEGYTLVKPGTSAKFVNINVKYPVVNAFGHTVAKNESSFAIQLPDEAFKDTTYTADTELSLSDTTFKHNAIGLLSKERTTLNSSTENVLFKPEVTLNSSADNISTQIVPTSSNRFIGLNVKYPVVNKYGHTVGLNTSIFSIQLPNTAFLNDNTTYSVTGNYELTSQGTEFRHETMGALSQTEEATTIGANGLSAAVTVGNSVSTTNSELSTSNKYIKFTLPYPKVNEFGHIFAKGTNSISIKLPDTAFSDTKYTADTTKELTTSGTNKFAHEGIGDLSEERADFTSNSSDGNTWFKPVLALNSSVKNLTAANGWNNFKPESDSRFISFDVKYPVVNAYGHVVALNSSLFSIELPSNAWNNTTYSATGNFDLKLDGTEFKHEEIGELSTAVASTTGNNAVNLVPSVTNPNLSWGNTTTLNIKYPKVNKFGHVIGTNNTDLSIKMPANPNTDTKYAAGNELNLNDTTFNHKEIASLSPDKSTILLGPSISKDTTTPTISPAFGETVIINIPNASVNKYGHVIDSSASSVSFKLPTPSYPVSSVSASGTIESDSSAGSLTLAHNQTTGAVTISLSGHTVNGIKTTGSPSYVTLTATSKHTGNNSYKTGSVDLAIDDSKLQTAIENLKAKDQFLKSVTYIDASTSNITYTTHSDESIATFAFKGESEDSTIAPTYKFAQSKYPVKTSFPALFFVWYTNVTDVSSDRDDLTTTGTLADYSLVPIAELKDPHYTFNSAASTVDKGVVFTTQTDTAGNVTVSATANLVWNEL